MNRNSQYNLRHTRLRLFFLMPVLLAYSSSVAGQDRPPEFTDEMDAAHQYLSDLSNMFAYTKTINEMKMTAKELETLDKFMHANFVKFLKVRDKSITPKEFLAELNFELDTIIGAERLSRSRELAARFMFRKLGFAATIAEFGSDRIELKAKALAKYKTESLKIATELTDKSDKLRQKCMAELTNVLSAEQQGGMREFLGNSNKVFLPPSLELLAWQLENTAHIEKFLQETGVKNFRELLIPSGSSTDLMGLKEVLQLSSGNRRHEGPDDPNSAKTLIGYELIRMLLSNRQHLTPQQLELVQSIQRSTVESQNVDGSNSAMQEVQVDRLVREIEQMLTPQQITGYNLLASRRMLDSAGFVTCMTAGEIGTQLAVTPEQKEKFLQLSKDLYKTIETQTIEWEEDALQRLIASLPEKNQSAVKKIFGKKTEHIRADIDSIIRRLSNP